MMFQWFKVTETWNTGHYSEYELHESSAFDSQSDFIDAIQEEIVLAADDRNRCHYYDYRGTKAEPVAPWEVPLKELESNLDEAEKNFIRMQDELSRKDQILQTYKDFITCHKAHSSDSEKIN